MFCLSFFAPIVFIANRDKLKEGGMKHSFLPFLLSGPVQRNTGAAPAFAAMHGTVQTKYTQYMYTRAVIAVSAPGDGFHDPRPAPWQGSASPRVHAFPSSASDRGRVASSAWSHDTVTITARAAAGLVVLFHMSAAALWHSHRRIAHDCIQRIEYTRSSNLPRRPSERRNVSLFRCALL